MQYTSKPNNKKYKRRETKGTVKNKNKKRKNKKMRNKSFARTKVAYFDALNTTTPKIFEKKFGHQRVKVYTFRSMLKFFY